MIVAAEAIPNDLPASELYPKSLAVIEGLKSHGVNVVSYACDGTQVERTVQDSLVSKAVRTISYRVPDPEGMDHTISLPIFSDSPVVMIQDSKHALKTMRNNLFSGARALVLGSHLAMYSYARDLAFTEIDGHPLYHRDVQKMDRQDDNAATRPGSPPQPWNSSGDTTLITLGLLSISLSWARLSMHTKAGLSATSNG